MKFPTWLNVYGDVNFRGQCPTETLEQVTFFARLRREYPDSYGAIGVHIKNEGKRTHYAAARDKASGMVAGAPDIIIPVDPPFICELKRRDHTKSKWQPNQMDYLRKCHEQGAFVCVALGHEAAWDALTALDNLRLTR